MRAYRVFNGVGRVDVEWTVIGQRYRVPSMSMLATALLTGAALCYIQKWLGASVAVAGSALVVWFNFRLNQMNPTGALNETTQLTLVCKSLRNPVILNTRRD